MTKEKIWDALHFIPLLATVGLFLLFVAASKTSGVLSDIISVIGVIGLIIGWLATLVVGNIKLVQMAFGIIKKGWTIGWSILPLFPICLFAAIVGLILGIYAVILGLFFVPAAFTIYMYFN